MSLSRLAIPATVWVVALLTVAVVSWGSVSASHTGPSFVPTDGPPTEARNARLATTRLADGEVLLVSGTTADLYDSATGTFRRTAGDLSSDRLGSSTTLLPDGRVLDYGTRNDIGTLRPSL